MTDRHPTRRRFQFGLRTLLLAVAVVAGLCGWLAVRIERARTQKHVVQEVRRRGGWVWYDYQLAGGAPDQFAQSPVPAWLRGWLGDDFFHRVTRIHLDYLLAPGWEDWDVSKLQARASDGDADAMVKVAELKVRSCGGEEVRYYLARALSIDPAHVRANLHTGAWLRQHDRPEQAVPYLDQVVRHADPDSLEWHHARRLLSGEPWTVEDLAAALRAAAATAGNDDK